MGLDFHFYIVLCGLIKRHKHVSSYKLRYIPDYTEVYEDGICQGGTDSSMQATKYRIQIPTVCMLCKGMLMLGGLGACSQENFEN